MRNAFMVVVFLLSANTAFAGSLSSWTHQLVEEVPQLSKEEIYSNTLAWFAEEFDSSKDVLQLQDKENGKIIGKGIIDFTYGWPIPMKAPMSFTLKVDIKENKYRLTYSKIKIDFDEYGSRPPGTNERGKVVKALDKLSNNLKEFMKTAPKDDNW